MCGSFKYSKFLFNRVKNLSVVTVTYNVMACMLSDFMSDSL